MDPVTLNVPPAEIEPGNTLPALTLRPPRESDLSALNRMFNDPEVGKHMMTPFPWTPKDQEGCLDRVAARWAEGAPRWTVADDDGDVVGTVGLRRDLADEYGLAYQTAPWARRRQVALRACRRAAQFAFEELSTPRLNWDAIVGNHLSRLIALRLGFHMEGVARNGGSQRGVRVDLWTGSLLPGELRELDDPPADYARQRARAATFTEPQPSLDVVEAPGLRLRPLQDSDADAVFDACQDSDMQRWTTIPRPYARSHAVEYLRGAQWNWRAGTNPTFALADADDRYCGAVNLGLGFAGDSGSAMIGFNTAPWARGKGYMTAATRRICAYAFDELAVERVVWYATVGNEASLRVAEKAGFVVEGTQRSGIVRLGRREDCWFGSLSRGEL